MRKLDIAQTCTSQFVTLLARARNANVQTPDALVVELLEAAKDPYLSKNTGPGSVFDVLSCVETFAEVEASAWSHVEMAMVEVHALRRPHPPHAQALPALRPPLLQVYSISPRLLQVLVTTLTSLCCACSHCLTFAHTHYLSLL